MRHIEFLGEKMPQFFLLTGFNSYDNSSLFLVSVFHVLKRLFYFYYI